MPVLKLCLLQSHLLVYSQPLLSPGLVSLARSDNRDQADCKLHL